MSEEIEFRTIMKFLRSRRGMSARQVSEYAGLSSSYVSKMEMGSVAPTLVNFAKIARVLEPTEAEIMFILLLLSGDAE